MAWLWDSFDEFQEYVTPSMLDKVRLFRGVQRESEFDRQHRYHEAMSEVASGMGELVELGFGQDPPPSDPTILGHARNAVLVIIRGGEMLLMLDRRLARSRYAYGFLHVNDFIEHWERFEGAGRIFRELNDFVGDVEELRRGIHELREADREYLVEDVEDLPDHLTNDFRLARDLFSLGLEDPGLLIAGRGLEGVIRELARIRAVVLAVKGKPQPLHECDAYDVVEAIARLRWKTDNSRLIDQETKALLQFVRVVRNGGAHPAGFGELSNRVAKRAARELACIAARAAGALWRGANDQARELVATELNKDWA